jgi:hypothetical protein
MLRDYIPVICILLLILFVFVIGFIMGAEGTAQMIRESVNLDKLCLLK